MTRSNLRKTQTSKSSIIFRLISGVPLVLFGTMHLVGAAPIEPILAAARVPLPQLNALGAPAIEVGTGLMLLSGWFTRIGALFVTVTKAVALYSHAIADWQGEPTPLIPVAVNVSAAYILWRGADAWSLDARAVAEREKTSW